MGAGTPRKAGREGVWVGLGAQGRCRLLQAAAGSLRSRGRRLAPLPARPTPPSRSPASAPPPHTRAASVVRGTQRRLLNPAAKSPGLEHRRGNLRSPSPLPPLLPASEKRKYVGRTLSIREVWRWAADAVKIPCSVLPPSGRCVFIPGPTQTLVNWVAATKPGCCQSQCQKRHSGPA